MFFDPVLLTFRCYRPFLSGFIEGTEFGMHSPISCSAMALNMRNFFLLKLFNINRFCTGGQLMQMVVFWNLLGIKKVTELTLTFQMAHGQILLLFTTF